MKILVVRQPWAWLIVNGHKDIENRTWATKYRGPLLISASKRPPDYAAFRIAEKFANDRGVEVPNLYGDRIQLGGIVGSVHLDDCVRQHPSPWFEGPVGWVVSGAQSCRLIPFAGALFLLDAPPSIVSAYQAAIRR